MHLTHEQRDKIAQRIGIKAIRARALYGEAIAVENATALAREWGKIWAADYGRSSHVESFARSGTELLIDRYESIPEFLRAEYPEFVNERRDRHQLLATADLFDQTGVNFEFDEVFDLGFLVGVTDWWNRPVSDQRGRGREMGYAWASNFGSREHVVAFFTGEAETLLENRYDSIREFLVAEYPEFVDDQHDQYQLLATADLFEHLGVNADTDEDFNEGFIEVVRYDQCPVSGLSSFGEN